MKLKLIFAAAATAALLAAALAGCVNPSDGTTFGGGGGGAQARPYAALIGTWGNPPVITFNADGTGFFHNPEPFLWTATGTTITITNVAGGEPFSISAGWAVNGGSLFFDGPAGVGESVLAALTAIAAGEAGLAPGNPDDPFMLRLTGQTWVERWDEETGLFFEERFTGSGIILPWPAIGGIGAVTNGQLNFTMGTPPLGLWEIEWLFSETQYTNLSISAPEARAGLIWELDIFDENGAMFGIFGRRGETDNYWEQVRYVFVDRDVVITGGGMTSTRTWGSTCGCDPCYCEEYLVDCICEWENAQTTVTQDLNISLRAGWNALHSREESLGMIDGVWAFRVTHSIGDPSHLRWIKRDWSLSPPPAPMPPWFNPIPVQSGARLGAPSPRARR